MNSTFEQTTPRTTMKIRNGKTVDKVYADICKRMKEIRIDNRLTQVEMAKVIGLTPSAVSAIENGSYTPNFTVLKKMKSQLGVSYAYIIDGVEDKEGSGEVEALKAEIKELRSDRERLQKMLDRLLGS